MSSVAEVRRGWEEMESMSPEEQYAFSRRLATMPDEEFLVFFRALPPEDQYDFYRALCDTIHEKEEERSE